ncbi:MAG: type I DNA topoisomerase [Planctomycetota bacterium]|jgi:DNA topoisomerase-1
MAKKKRSTRTQTIDASGKQLVIVESPAKARTINKYLGDTYTVAASVGHVRDLPAWNPKGVKAKDHPVPGVDLNNSFEPEYQVLPDKKQVVTQLKKAAKQATDVWFATDLDREGEAIAWHLAHELGIEPSNAKRVVFNAITRAEIQRAFAKPLPIDEAKVNAQQARRVLDRIVGYQVSPLLWKKVARGLSAGRVQSVAVRLIVEREREIKAFRPDEYWKVNARFTFDDDTASKLISQWEEFLETTDDKGNTPTVKKQNAWMSKHHSLRGELVEVAGEKFDASAKSDEQTDLTERVRAIVELAGLREASSDTSEDADAKGRAQTLHSVTGVVDPSTPYEVSSIEKKRTTTRPSGPFITSTLQQASSTRLGFAAQRTMRVAQQLYEGIDIPGTGSVGLITYMRTDSTHIAGEALTTVRNYISDNFGDAYLPEKPNFFGSQNKQAQEAHEAIRPTSIAYPPEQVKSSLTGDQYKLYKLIWERYVSCQMTPAKWDSTSVFITGGTDPAQPVTFKASGRLLVFDGFYKVAGVPTASDEQTLPEIDEGHALHPFAIEPEQKFTSPPPRFTEASLIKTLESEGIGRPSTYASIIQVIQQRKYVELLERRFWATDLGEVVTDKLIEAFPQIMEVSYTRELEGELDAIENEHTEWKKVLDKFYGPFEAQLEAAHENLKHAKAETQPAPEEYRCEKCEASLVYRFGKNGRFLSCSTYPECDYACPCDRDGKPQPIQNANVACFKCNEPMIKRTGRFGPFYGCSAYPECDGILKADKLGRPLAPQPPAMATELQCSKCEEAHLVLRNGVRGPWLACSRYPKCRGRGKWKELDDALREKLESALAAHEKKHPIPIIRDLEGKPLTDAKGKPLEDVDQET